tara:strand:- start:174 stop:929 length:756 start_codon:yes stop_codon:yes gene_type:complete
MAIPSSNIKFSDKKEKYNNSGITSASGHSNLQTSSGSKIKLSYFINATFTSGHTVPNPLASPYPHISISDHFIGKTFGTQATTYEFNASHIPTQSSTYSGAVRGLWFRNTTGSAMTITEIQVATDNSGNQSIWVGDLGTSPPANYSSTSTASNAEMVKNNTDTWWTVPNSGLTIQSNNYVGILGKRSTNSYGSYGGNTITFPSGDNITIYRFIHQGHLYNTSYSATSLPVSNNNSAWGTSSISRIFFKYTL